MLEVGEDVDGGGAPDLAVDVVPGLARAPVSGPGAGDGNLVELPAVDFSKQGVLFGIVAAVEEVEAAEKADDLSLLAVGGERVHGNGFLVVGEGGGDPRGIQSGESLADDWGMIEKAEGVFVLGFHQTGVFY